MTSNHISKALYAVAAATLFGFYGAIAVAAEQTTESSPAKGEVTAQQLTTATATVEAVDMKSRVLTLKDSEGQEFEVTAGDKVKNLQQVKVGDQVQVDYYQALTLQLNKMTTDENGETSEFALFTAEPGTKPAGAAVQKMTVTAEVTKIDHDNQTVTLKGPKRTVQLPIENPDVLAKLKVGDKVSATYTQALAAAIEPAPKQ
jgi:Cu/Ag efflux protein CusF